METVYPMFLFRNSRNRIYTIRYFLPYLFNISQCGNRGIQKGERLLSFRRVREPDRKGIGRFFPPFLSAQKWGARAA